MATVVAAVVMKSVDFRRSVTEGQCYGPKVLTVLGWFEARLPIRARGVTTVASQ